jgi:uncharacterized protein
MHHLNLSILILNAELWSCLGPMARLIVDAHFKGQVLRLLQTAQAIVEDFREAIKPHPRGLTIRFEVTAGSYELVVPSGFNPWRRTLEARLTEEPTKGKANRQLVEEVARILGTPERDVEVLSGHKSARKVLLVTGLNPDVAVHRLNSRR